MQLIHESTHARVVEVGMLAHVQERTPQGWRTVREFLPQFDTFDWRAACSLARSIEYKHQERKP